MGRTAEEKSQKREEGGTARKAKSNAPLVVYFFCSGREGGTGKGEADIGKR